MKADKLTIDVLVILAVVAGASVSDFVPIVSGAQGHSVHALAQEPPGWQQVNNNGFGDPQTGEVSTLEPFDGHLYAGTSNSMDGARIFRSPDGVTWAPVTEPGFGISHDIAPPAILDLTVFNGRLYASTGRGDGPGQIWRALDGVHWAPMVISGFSDPDTVDITALAVYNNALYAGAKNLSNGAQLWRSFTGDSNSWTQVAPGTPGTAVSRVTGLAVFDGALYAAVESDAPAQIWFSYGGDWMTAVSDGFGDSQTTATGGMTEFAGHLYVGAGNTVAGAQLWRTNDGETWVQVIDPGFGDPNNLKVEMVFVFQNRLYASVKNTQTGVETWRSKNGTIWERANLDGFGDSHNTGSNWSNATAHFLNQLYVGTSNVVDGGELWRMQQPYGVTLSPDQAKLGLAGQTVAYALTVTNTGTITDSFDLTATGKAWTTTLSAALVKLAPSTSTIFTVTVAIPPSAAAQQTDTVTVTAISQGDSSKTASTVLTTTSMITPVYSVALSPDDSLSGPVGHTVTYTLSIANIGNVTDSFDLTITGQTWTATLSTSLVNLAPTTSAHFSVTVAIPLSAADQETDTVTVTATSQGNNSKTDSAVLTTISVAAPVYGVALSPDESLSGPSGEIVTYALTITNTGTVVETVDLLPTGNSWTTTLSSQVVTVAAGGSRAVTITVLIPPTVAALERDQVSIQATCRHDSSKKDIAVLTTESIGQSTRNYLPLVVLDTPQ